jgi:DNA-binding protein WhiA
MNTFSANLKQELKQIPVKNKSLLEQGKSLTPTEINDDGDAGIFLRGVFLATGSITNPEKGYHLELRMADAETAEKIFTVITNHGLFAKTGKRRGKNIIYIKESGQIEDFLTFIGGSRLALEIMNVKIIKKVRENLNRKANFEVANIIRTTNASAGQIADIKLILQNQDKQPLTPELKEAALLRADNPDLTLRELAALCNPPLTRSGLNHRLQKLHLLAEELKGTPQKRIRLIDSPK